MTEDQLRRATVGELKPHNSNITLVEYDPNWPILYRRESERIRTILGKNALQLEHVGSTSVPGLVAKPIVDILLVVKNSADEQSYIPALEAKGYRLTIREPDWHEHRLLKGPDTNINLHVFSERSSEINRMLAFRDWLRNNAEDRALYANAKRNLAQRKWNYVQQYADAKSKVVEEIIRRAQSLEWHVE